MHAPTPPILRAETSLDSASGDFVDIAYMAQSTEGPVNCQRKIAGLQEAYILRQAGHGWRLRWLFQRLVGTSKGLALDQDDCRSVATQNAATARVDLRGPAQVDTASDQGRDVSESAAELSPSTRIQDDISHALAVRLPCDPIFQDARGLVG